MHAIQDNTYNPDVTEMSATQISKPRDEQEFERCNLVLWRCILKDETTHLYGRRGQRQHGVDILGCRNANPANLVGVQCKLKAEGKRLRDEEVRQEIEKALTFRPPLSEYVIVTTAPDDAKLQSLARELAIQVNEGRQNKLTIAVLGWDNLQVEIQRHPDAIHAFDPSYTSQGEQIQQAIQNIPDEVSNVLTSKIDIVHDAVATLKSDQIAIEYSTVQSEHERLINDYVTLIPDKPETALQLLRSLEERLAPNASDHVRFRIKTNIAACQLEMGQDSTAATGLIAAWSFAPEDPKAVANRVLGFMLLENWNLVRELAEEGLEKQPSNARLAGCFVRSCIHDESTEDPISRIPAETRKTPEVVEAHVQWLMERGGPSTWWDAAISAYQQFPDIPEMQELGASALLSRAIGGEPYVYGGHFDTSDLADVKTAIEMYDSLWREVRDGRRRRRRDLSSIPVNLMIAHHIVGNPKTAINVGLEACQRFPDEDKIKEYLASFLVDQGDTTQASDLLCTIEDSTQATVVRFKIAFANKDWAVISKIVDEHLAQFPESEHVVARAMGMVAHLEQTPTADVRDVMDQADVEFRDSTRALVIVARAARVRGVEDLSESLFESAVLAFQNGSDSYVDRIAIAEEATARGLVGLTVEALDCHVALDRDSAELRWLAQALTFDVPVRDRAVRFFDDLEPEIRRRVYFQRLEGILHFNRGEPKEAIQPLRRAFEEEPQIDTLLCLVRAHFAIKDRDSIQRIVDESEVENLSGSPLDRIHLSHVLLDFADAIRALRAGYGALIADLMDAELTSKFFGLVLRATSTGLVRGADESVGSGVWVRLARRGGGSYEALVGESQDRPWGQAVPESNSFISACMGRRIGEEFQITNSLGIQENWTVAEIKPRWLQAFHYLTVSFGQRFPDAAGFASLTIVDDDIGPVLEQVPSA